MPRVLVNASLIGLFCIGWIALSSSTVGSAEPSYFVKLNGVENEELRELLLGVSKLYAGRGKNAAGLVILRRRAEVDRERFRAVLRSQGYYDGRVRFRIDDSSMPLQVTVAIDTGVPYLLSRFNVHFNGEVGSDEEVRADRVAASLKIGRRAVAERILSTEQELVSEFRDKGFPFTELVERKAVVDHATRSLAADVTLDLGPRATFGELRIEGETGLKEVYVRRRVAWRRGESWKADLVESSRRKLTETGLFSSVRIEHDASLLPDGTLPMVVHLEKAKHRSLGAGVRYASTDGPGLSLFWEHRNFLGGGERVRVATTLSDLEQSISAAYREPDFLSPKQILLVDFGYVREDTDAFLSRTAKTKAGVQRRLSSAVTVRAGLVLERSTVEEAGAVSEDFLLVGLPMTLNRDTADDMLDPTHGNRLELSVVPYLKGLGSEVEFYSARVTEALYLPFDSNRKAVLAVRASLGSLSGAGLDAIPADKRFYAGGGGSLRGYGFQLAGPLDAGGDPIGGLSLLEIGAELRLRVNERWGLVPFVEGGNVFGKSLPNFDDPLFWGAGLGLRLFTPVGPVRLDVAVPLDRRAGIDSSFQIYVSLGQSF